MGVTRPPERVELPLPLQSALVSPGTIDSVQIECDPVLLSVARFYLPKALMLPEVQNSALLVQTTLAYLMTYETQNRGSLAILDGHPELIKLQDELALVWWQEIRFFKRWAA